MLWLYFTLLPARLHKRLEIKTTYEFFLYLKSLHRFADLFERRAFAVHQDTCAIDFSGQPAHEEDGNKQYG